MPVWTIRSSVNSILMLQKKAAEKKAKDTKKSAVQADDLITFRQFTKKTANDGVDDVSSSANYWREND